jgi:hypothetical protein
VSNTPISRDTLIPDRVKFMAWLTDRVYKLLAFSGRQLYKIIPAEN